MIVVPRISSSGLKRVRSSLGIEDNLCVEIPSEWVEEITDRVTLRIEDQARWVTVAGLAAWLGCEPSHVYDLRQRGLPAHRLVAEDGTKSKKLLFRLREVSDWLTSESVLV